MLTAIRAIASRIRSRSWSRNEDHEFQRELESHLQMLTEENVQRGMTPHEAARAARVRLGGVTQLRETNRELRGLPFLETLSQDARFAFRMLGKNPGFAAVAIFTLALGIGANTAIFSVVHAVLLKPMPYTRSQELFNVFQERLEDGTKKTGWSYKNFADFRQQTQSFSEMAGAQRHQMTLTGRGEPMVVDTSVVTPELFSVFDGKPLLGRTFSTEDGKPGAAPVVIVGENLWRGAFGADPGIVGSSVALDKRSFTIIGVMPSAFRYPQVRQSNEIWVPLVNDPLFGSWMERRSGHWLQVTGRLKPEVSMAQAQTEMDSLAARFAKEFPEDNDGWAIRMVPLQQMIVGDVKPALLVLLGAVGLVLLIACANIANLLLARATSRAREIAVRSTLGAGRGRLIRQLLSETAILGLLGGVTGIALAWWDVRALSSLLPATLPQVNAVRIDHSVLGFALFLSVFASCVVGLAPAFLLANSNLQGTLREGGGRSGQSAGSRRARSILAMGEVALAMVLLVAAGLLLRSFSRLTATSPGFDVQHVVKAEVSLPRFQYATPQQWATFSDNLLTQIQAEPGMKQTALAVPLPLADGFVNLSFDIEGAPPLSAAASRTANYVAITPNYFRVMGISLIKGRTFDQRDTMNTPRVTVISSALARVYFQDRDPIGHRITFGFPPDPGAAREIVGVVGDVRDVALGNDPGPMMYVPYAQAPFPGACIVVKSTLSPSGVTGAIRQKLARIDKDLPLIDIATMADAVEVSVSQPRFRTLLLGVFAAMALILATTGIFGVISYSVSCRTNEIGIRVALGASNRGIMRMVLRETLALALAGLAVGIPCALAASHLLGHMLFGISPNDPVTLVSVAAALAGVAALAGYVPARRAMRVDPMVALRHE
jgi:putative ABC transport system permease protein